MNKNKLEKQVNNRYTELVDSLILKAILNNEAVSMRQNVSKNNDLSQVFSKVVINDYLLEIDFEIDIKYGFSITEISCMLQEQIKNDIEKNTKFKVKKINILVKNVTV
ncbi:MAG: Asp23/Gls24 family envelope stress response protein [Clostridia bacterium]|nr:Asp23/Gls24 family envelope stress response protein [Clostridia bacterium]